MAFCVGAVHTGANQAPMDPTTTTTPFHDVLVVGAGPAGLATAACLTPLGLDVKLIDRALEQASSWRHHYERLHLHTVKTHSALPGLPFPDNVPRYVPRQGVVDYLLAYARHHGLRPELGHEVVAIEPAPAGSVARWHATTAAGQGFSARHVVVATGANRKPVGPELPGQADFGGRILHSRSYRNASPFAGQRVLVVGMGNTGAEIALDLVENKVRTALSVRSPVNIVLRDVLGRPTQLSSIALSKLPAAWGDALAVVLRNLTVGDLSRYGLQTAPHSPLRQLREDGRTPVIDVGTVQRIKAGDIQIYPGIQTLTPGGVRFAGGEEHPFDVVLLATGYDAALRELFPRTALPLDERGMPPGTVGVGALEGVYFVGFDVRQPGGLLRSIGLQARAVAQDLARA